MRFHIVSLNNKTPLSFIIKLFLLNVCHHFGYAQAFINICEYEE